MDYLEAGYLGLFVVCFLSATILPLTSEGVLIAFLLSGGEPITALLVATSGNVLGGSTNYFLGRIGEPKWLRKLGVKETRIVRFENWVKRYGVWTALLSWVPIVGDPLTIALGFFRANWWWVFLLMLLGKFLRYLLLVLPWILD
jgi:membrane protein YqaA with SNARE-associated domain